MRLIIFPELSFLLRTSWLFRYNQKPTEYLYF